jgi:hypothetical protein
MSQRLREVLQKILIKEGEAGKKRLAKAVGRTSTKTIDRWLKDGVPKAHYAYKLALQCGCSEEDALKMAQEECASEVARETA